ncbi:MAG TPA: site-specific integrase, partial [Bryobacteraceae bacterium]|nr:site-specific integrase [Bryobacteraceae bacterium]
HYTFASLKPYLVEKILATVAPTKSAKFRRNIYQTAQWVLNDAATNGLMPKAPVIPLPSVPVRRVEAVPPEDVTRVIAAMPSPMREAATLALLTGIREGELLALTWDHIDLDKATLTVEVARDQSGIEVSPKSKAGVRTIPLSPATVAFLRAYKHQQELARQKRLAAIDQRMTPKRPRRPDTLRAGKAGRQQQALMDPDFQRYLFPAIPRKQKRLGRLPVLDDSRLRKAFQQATRAAGVPMRWHDLRHAFASIMLAEGGEGVLPVLAAILGHSSSAFTLHQYTHMIPTRAHSYMTAVDEALGLGPDNPPDSDSTREGGGDGDATTNASLEASHSAGTVR